MLVRLVGEQAAGLYAAGARLTEMMHVLPLALGAVFMPRLAAAFDRGSTAYTKVARTAGGLVLVLTVPAALAAPLLALWGIPLLLGDSYRSTVAVWQVHVWTLVFVAIVSLRSRLWVVKRRTHWTLGLALITAILNLGGNLILISKYGGIGLRGREYWPGDPQL